MEVTTSHVSETTTHLSISSAGTHTIIANTSKADPPHPEKEGTCISEIQPLCEASHIHFFPHYADWQCQIPVGTAEPHKTAIAVNRIHVCGKSCVEPALKWV